MKKRTAAAWAIGVMLLSTSANRPGAAGALLIELDPRAGAFPAAVSANNVVVVGSLDGGGGFYWAPTRGVIFNGGVSSEGVSGDGRTIVGTALDPNGVSQAAIWLQRTEWQLLGSFTPTAAPCDKSLGAAYDVSRDGQVIVGIATNGCSLNHAFRWTASTGMVDLGSAVQGRATSAVGVSGNGHIAVGYQESSIGMRQGARWLDGREELFPGVDGFVGFARAANNDGSIVVGETCRPALGNVEQSAWVWSAQGGTKCLPAPQRMTTPGPGAGPLILVQANATSDDGKIIGGGQNVGGSNDSEAVIWVSGRPFYLKNFLRVNGVPDAFATWVNTGEITGITPDGRILVGFGAAKYGFRGYVVVLPASLVIP